MATFSNLSVLFAVLSNLGVFAEKNAETETNSCRLYLAPTTVGGIEGNYGIFTAVDLKEGDTVLSNDGPSIPVLVDSRKKSKLFPNTEHLGLFDNVWWGPNGNIANRFQYEVGKQGWEPTDELIEELDYIWAADMQINFGALPNCHPYQSNLDVLQPEDGVEYNGYTFLEGPKDPKRGSFSYYTGKHFLVDRDVEAGMELFLDYSGDWLQHGFPRKQDYFSAGALVRKWILSIEPTANGRAEHETTHPPTRTATSAQKFLDSVQTLHSMIAISSPGSSDDSSGYDYHDSEEDRNYYEKNREDIEEGTYLLDELTSRVLSVIPKTVQELNAVYSKAWELYIDRKANIVHEDIDTAGPQVPSVLDVTDAMYIVSKPAPKTAQELKETGICLDHIVAGKSTTPMEMDSHATDAKGDHTNFSIGRGAIANRHLAKDDLIVPVPFLHLLDRSLFETNGSTLNPNDELLLNYCFGHSESTMILCPVTNAVMVNHCSGRNGKFPCPGGNGPNAHYRWASNSEWDPKTKHTLNMTLDELAAFDYQKQHRMLSMEIIASRDIEGGEEIFIDYGEKWEEAWFQHVEKWSCNIAEGDENDEHSVWNSPLTEYELNHWDRLVHDEDMDHNDYPIFYGEVRGVGPAVSEDGRFMATCWYESLMAAEGFELGSKHSWDPEDNDFETGEVYWKKLTDEDIFGEYAIDVRANPFIHYRDHSPGTIGHFWPCTIISEDEYSEEDSEDHEERYIVRIYPSTSGETEYDEVASHLLLKSYPKSSIRFVTVPFLSDQHHPKAFRHHIEINNDIFPEQWKNKKLSTEL